MQLTKFTARFPMNKERVDGQQRGEGKEQTIFKGSNNFYNINQRKDSKLKKIKITGLPIKVYFFKRKIRNLQA